MPKHNICIHLTDRHLLWDKQAITMRNGPLLCQILLNLTLDMSEFLAVVFVLTIYPHLKMKLMFDCF